MTSMFGGGTTNPYDEVVSEYPGNLPLLSHIDTVLSVKTTDENLTSENWELILNLCDKVQDEGQEGLAMITVS